MGEGAADPLKSGTELFKNDEIRVWTLDGEVLIASITCKLHLISPAVIEGLLESNLGITKYFSYIVIKSPIVRKVSFTGSVPVVLGCLHNNEKTVPVTLPDNKTQTGIMTRSSTGGGTSDYNALIFDAEEAERSVAFFERYCVLWEGEWAGRPFVLSPWQAMNVREMYGWKREGSGYRRFGEAYWEIARKNGKIAGLPM